MQEDACRGCTKPGKWLCMVGSRRRSSGKWLVKKRLEEEVVAEK